MMAMGAPPAASGISRPLQILVRSGTTTALSKASSAPCSGRMASGRAASEATMRPRSSSVRRFSSSMYVVSISWIIHSQPLDGPLSWEVRTVLLPAIQSLPSMCATAVPPPVPRPAASIRTVSCTYPVRPGTGAPNSPLSESLKYACRISPETETKIMALSRWLRNTSGVTLLATYSSVGSAMKA